MQHFSPLARGLAFEIAQGLAVIVAMTSNFFLNNYLTYRDRRLQGWRILSGLLSFAAICSLGAVANVGVASFVFSDGGGVLIAGAAGAIVGSVWNFAASSFLTWKKKT